MIPYYFEIHDMIKTAFQNSSFTQYNHKALGDHIVITF